MIRIFKASLIRTVLAAFVFIANGCDHLLDEATRREEEYIYQIHNKTASPLRAEYELAGNHIIGDRNMSETIQPGETKKLWVQTGERERMVSDFEKLNPTISVFTTVRISQDGKNASTDVLNPAQWQYKQETLYRAVYTLPITPTDF